MKGLQIAAFILVVSLAVGMLGGAGWFAWVGVSPDPGTEEYANETTDAAQEDVEAEESETEQFGLVRGALNTLNTIRSLTSNVSGFLTNLGVPAWMAWPIQGIVYLTVMVMMVQVVRGMRFR